MATTSGNGLHDVEPPSVSLTQSSPLKVGGGVSLFGVRFHLATDDFFLPAVIGSLCRFGLLAIYVAIHVYASMVAADNDDGIVYNNGPSEDSSLENLTQDQIVFDSDLYPCIYTYKLYEFMISTIVILALNIVILQLLAWNSRLGYIWQETRLINPVPHPRRWVVPLLYLSTAGHLAEIVTLGIGTYFLTTAYLNPDCVIYYNYPMILLTAAITLEYLGLAIILSIVWILTKDKCCPLIWGRKNRRDGSGGIFYTFLSYVCFSKSKSKFFDDAADILDDFFPDDKFVPTDVLAALVLIYAHEEVRHSRLRRHLEERRIRDEESSIEAQIIATNASPIFLQQLSSLPEWQNPQKLFRFMQYSAAAYGYKMYIAGGGSGGPNPFTRLKELHRHAVCCACCCCCCLTPRPDFSEFSDKDNCCLCDFAAIKASLPFLDEDDIVFASFQNGFLETPFFVAIDRLTSSVVVVLRGTLSVPDIITDFAAKPCQISMATSCADFFNGPEFASFNEYLCHTGMREAAFYVYKQLEEKHLLEKAFSRCPDFNLVVTGHSLGAGTAAILAFLLRHKYQNVKCYSYGPPGGLLSRAALEASRSFCVSVIVGADIVPRITIQAVHKLREQMVQVLRDSQISKYNILSYGLLGRYCGSDKEWLKRIEEDFRRITERRRSSSDESTDPILITIDQNYGATTQEQETTTCVFSTEEMFPPGNILFFEKSKLTSERHLVNVAVKDVSEFSEILVTPSMISDHVPATYLKTLQEALVASGR